MLNSLCQTIVTSCRVIMNKVVNLLMFIIQCIKKYIIKWLVTLTKVFYNFIIWIKDFFYDKKNKKIKKTPTFICFLIFWFYCFDFWTKYLAFLVESCDSLKFSLINIMYDYYINNEQLKYIYMYNIWVLYNNLWPIIYTTIIIFYIINLLIYGFWLIFINDLMQGIINFTYLYDICELIWCLLHILIEMLKKTSLIFNPCDVLLGFIIIHIILVILFSLKQINYKKTLFSISCILIILWGIVSWLLINEVDFTINYNLNLNNVFYLIPIFNIKIDHLSLMFLFTIYIISMFVHMYQHFYLLSEPRKDIFLIGLNCFILSMVLVVIASNWILFFLAWEVLGISSFFLIGFYKHKISAWKSSKKAFFFNKISDLLLLITLGFYLKLNESWLINSSLTNNNNYTIIVFCLTLMAFLKSAQFVFYLWLPDSMEAPIPASALIHSATLVSAGIYIVLRFNLFEHYSINYQIFIHVTIYLTMIFAPLLASMQTDIKKLLAYSTISNCSFIFFLILVKLTNFALIYFVLHGVLKSSCFLIAGILILMQKHYQDVNKWNITNIYDKLLLLFLSFSTLILSGSPLFFIYNLKSNINLLYSENQYMYFLTILTILLYTLISYLYGLKLFYLFINKQTQPIFRNLTHKDNTLPKAVIVLIVYALVILSLILFFFYKQFTLNVISYNIIILISILIISLILLSSIKKWPDYILILSLINLIVVFLTAFYFFF